MKYRIAKISDLNQIVNIRFSIREVNSLGIFSHMGKPFLRRYYKILLNDPGSIFVCAENPDGKILGYNFIMMDSNRHAANMKRHSWSLICGAIGSLISSPFLLKPLWVRYRSLQRHDQKFVHMSGARGGYWGWDPLHKDSESSYELHEKTLEIAHILGVEKLYFEVDKANRHVFKFHKFNGAIINQTILLPDGRERALMSYDLTNHKSYL